MLALLACLGYFFKDNFLKNQNIYEGQSLAKLVKKSNQVRFKKSQGLNWQELDKAIPLFQNDQVFTQDNSTATLKFIDGTSVDMAAKTLIKIDNTGESVGLDLLEGYMLATIDKNGQSNLNISSKGQKLVIAKGSRGKIIVERDKNGKSKISALGGSLELNIDGKKIKLDEKNILEIDNSGKSKVIKKTITLIKPRKSQKIWTQGIEKIEFLWKAKTPLKEGQEYRVYIDQNFNLKKPKYSKTLKEESLQLDSLDYGNYFWRVDTVEGEKVISSSLRSPFSHYEDRAPKLISPKNKESLNFAKKKTESAEKIIFTWENMEAKGYEFELVLKNGKIVKNGKTKKSSIALKFKKLFGDYKWKVRVSDKSRPNSPWSEYNTVKLGNGNNSQIPQLVMPENNEKVLIGQNIAEPVRFSWLGDKNSKYRIEVALDKDFQMMVFEKVHKGNQYDWFSRVFGTYYVRIVNIDLEGGLNSATNQFFVQAAAPNLLFPNNQDTIVMWRPGSQRFIWEKVFFEQNLKDMKNKKSYYLFQAHTNEEQEKPHFQDKAYLNYYDWQNPTFGRLRWRVKAKPYGSDGSWSRMKEVSIEKSPPPPAPTIKKNMRVKIKKKKNSAFIKVNKHGRSPASLNSRSSKSEYYSIIKWQEMEHVKNYQIEIYQDKYKRKLLTRKKVSRPRFKWRNPKAGKFYYRVRAIDYWGQRSPFSPLATLNLSYANGLISHPQLQYPRNKEEINYEQEDETKFQWKGNKYSNDYKLVIAKDKNFNDIVYSKQFSGNNANIKPNDLDFDGLYHWKVIAKYSDSESKESSSHAIQFTPEEMSLEEEISELDDFDAPKKYYSSKKIRDHRGSYLLFNYAPSSTFAKQDDSLNLIQGESYDAQFIAGELEFYKGLKNNYVLQGNLHTIRGESWLEGVDYQSTDLSLSAGKSWGQKKNYIFGLMGGLSYQSYSKYVLESATLTNSQESFTGFNIKSFMDFYVHSNWSHGMFSEITISSATALKLGYTTRYKPSLSSNKFYNTGLFFSRTSFEADSYEIEYQNFGLFAGMGLLF